MKKHHWLALVFVIFALLLVYNFFTIRLERMGSIPKSRSETFLAYR